MSSVPHTIAPYKLVVVLLSSLVFTATALGQTSASKPIIESIDPPDWFVQLPPPMLLLHGSGFNHAGFKVKGKSIRLDRIQVSDNGHWAFLWISTQGAPAQTLVITATNEAGVTAKD